MKVKRAMKPPKLQKAISRTATSFLHLVAEIIFIFLIIYLTGSSSVAIPLRFIDILILIYRDLTAACWMPIPLGRQGSF